MSLCNGLIFGTGKYYQNRLRKRGPPLLLVFKHTASSFKLILREIVNVATISSVAALHMSALLIMCHFTFMAPLLLIVTLVFGGLPPTAMALQGSEGYVQELRSLRRQIRAAQQRQRRLKCPSQNALCLKVASSMRACLVFHFSSQEDVVVDFVLGHGQSRKKKIAKLTKEERRSIYEQVRKAHDEQVVTVEADVAAFPAAVGQDGRAACRFVIEHKLYKWIWAQNCLQGVAPSRRQLVEQVGKFLPHRVQGPLRAGVQKFVADSSARRQRKWLQSFRRRWNARLGTLKVQEDVSQEMMQSKAGSSVDLVSGLVGALFDTCRK